MKVRLQEYCTILILMMHFVFIIHIMHLKKMGCHGKGESPRGPLSFDRQRLFLFINFQFLSFTTLSNTTRGPYHTHGVYGIHVVPIKDTRIVLPKTQMKEKEACIKTVLIKSSGTDCLM